MPPLEIPKVAEPMVVILYPRGSDNRFGNCRSTLKLADHLTRTIDMIK